MKRGAAILAVVGVLLFVFAPGRISLLGGLCIVIAAVMFATTISAGTSKPSKKQTQLADEMRAKGYKYVAAAPDGSAIGLDAARRQIFLRDAQKRSKEYPFDSVRSWRIHHQETGKTEVIPGGSFAQQMGALGMAHRANRDATRTDRESNGLFIRVKDIDSPEWHIGMQSASDQSRWHEILTQYINEG